MSGIKSVPIEHNQYLAGMRNVNNNNILLSIRQYCYKIQSRY